MVPTDQHNMQQLLAISLAVITAATTPQAQQLDTARVERLAEGVFVIVHPDATEDWPHSNTGIIIGDDGVLVVDATYLPSRAAADIAIIRTLTSLPVRYLVNTHWHYDHINGNATYKAAFPGLIIVSQTETRRLIAVNGERYARSVVAAGSASRQELAKRKDAVRAGTPARAALDDVANRERELQELAGLRIPLPTLTFEHALTLYLGNKDVRLHHWGAANTPGDVAIYVPGDSILFAGDLLVSPVPYAFNSSPVGWIDALRAMEGLPVKRVVPGHGSVEPDLAYTRQVRALLEYVVSNVHRLAAEGKTVEETRKALNLEAFRQQFVGSDSSRQATWDDSIIRALIDRAWQSARGAH